jgi:hypothetical protein
MSAAPILEQGDHLPHSSCEALCNVCPALSFPGMRSRLEFLCCLPGNVCPFLRATHESVSTAACSFMEQFGHRIYQAGLSEALRAHGRSHLRLLNLSQGSGVQGLQLQQVLLLLLLLGSPLPG